MTLTQAQQTDLIMAKEAMASLPFELLCATVCAHILARTDAEEKPLNNLATKLARHHWDKFI